MATKTPVIGYTEPTASTSTSASGIVVSHAPTNYETGGENPNDHYAGIDVALGKIDAAPTTSAAGNYTVLVTDHVILKTGITAGGDSVDLPSATVSTQRPYIIADTAGTAGTNNITITTEGSETINGETTYVINENYGSVTLKSDGSNYFIVSASLPSDLGTKDHSLTVYNIGVDVNTTTGYVGFPVPASLSGYNLVGFIPHIHTLGTSSGSETIDVNLVRRRAGSDVNMLSTAATLEKTEYFIADGVIDTSNDDLATGDLLIPILTNNLLTTDAKGCFVVMSFRKP